MAAAFLFALYCFEAGIFFLIVPWTRFWSLDPLLHSAPWIGAVVTNLFFRGFVSGFGIVHILAGFREVASLIEARRQRDVQ
ncbi:MAG: hypothetical protein WBX15_03260 [Thermoanaerobaculia bacterium]